VVLASPYLYGRVLIRIAISRDIKPHRKHAFEADAELEGLATFLVSIASTGDVP